MHICAHTETHTHFYIFKHLPHMNTNMLYLSSEPGFFCSWTVSPVRKEVPGKSQLSPCHCQSKEWLKAPFTQVLGKEHTGASVKAYTGLFVSASNLKKR